jgi:hypothetical protein
LITYQGKPIGYAVKTSRGEKKLLSYPFEFKRKGNPKLGVIEKEIQINGSGKVQKM